MEGRIGNASKKECQKLPDPFMLPQIFPHSLTLLINQENYHIRLIQDALNYIEDR